MNFLSTSADVGCYIIYVLPKKKRRGMQWFYRGTKLVLPIGTTKLVLPIGTTKLVPPNWYYQCISKFKSTSPGLLLGQTGESKVYLLKFATMMGIGRVMQST